MAGDRVNASAPSWRVPQIVCASYTLKTGLGKMGVTGNIHLALLPSLLALLSLTHGELFFIFFFWGGGV